MKPNIKGGQFVYAVLAGMLVSGLSTVQASAYLYYELDKARSKMTYNIIELSTKTEYKGQFPDYIAYVDTPIDTTITSWNRTHESWITWDGDIGKKESTGDENNDIGFIVKLESITQANESLDLLAENQFYAEKYPELRLSSIELTDTSAGKGIVANLTIRDVTKVVYVPVAVEELDGSAVRIQGHIEADLLNFNFVPKTKYHPCFNSEYYCGDIELPFVLTFDLTFIEGVGD